MTNYLISKINDGIIKFFLNKIHKKYSYLYDTNFKILKINVYIIYIILNYKHFFFK